MPEGHLLGQKVSCFYLADGKLALVRSDGKATLVTFNGHDPIEPVEDAVKRLRSLADALEQQAERLRREIVEPGIVPVPR